MIIIARFVNIAIFLSIFRQCNDFQTTKSCFTISTAGEAHEKRRTVLGMLLLWRRYKRRRVWDLWVNDVNIGTWETATRRLQELVPRAEG